MWQLGRVVHVRCKRVCFEHYYMIKNFILQFLMGPIVYINMYLQTTYTKTNSPMVFVANSTEPYKAILGVGFDYISLTYSFSDIVPSSGALVFVNDFLVKTTGWWFQTFIIFTRKIGDDDPIFNLRIFFKGVGSTTN